MRELVIEEFEKSEEEIKADKQPIGKFSAPTSFQSHKVDLQKDDLISIFSDGYVDQFGGEKGNKFKAKSLRSSC